MESSLLSNKTNLLPALIDFIRASETLTLYSAFIKQDLLEEIIKIANGSIKQIVVRWQAYDLIMGVSDIDIYETCKENNITLYRNSKLHAKCIINENNDCILGSANYTNNGMRNTPYSNWEVNTRVNQLDVESQLLLKRILNDSILVSDQWVNETRKLIDEKSIQLPKVELPIQKNDKDFLLSALPLSKSPRRLFEIINGLEEESLDTFEREASIHDIALYDLQMSDFKNLDVFLDILRTNFIKHSFILAFLKFLYSKEDKMCGYTEACIWIAANCEDVPIPSRFSIRDASFVDPLFVWCAFFCENISNDNKYAKNTGRNQLLIKSQS